MKAARAPARPRRCPGCGAALERVVQALRGEGALLCSFVASCPDCGWMDAVCSPGLLPPPWRDAALAEARLGLLVGVVDRAALAVALRRALGLSAAAAAARAEARGPLITGLPIEVEWLRDALLARGLPCRAAPFGDGPRDLLLNQSASGRRLAALSPRARRAKSVLNAFGQAGGAVLGGAAEGALRFGAAAALGVAAPGRRATGPRALIDSEGALVDAAMVGPAGGEGEALLFDALVAGLPATGAPAVIALDGADRGPWPLSVEACAGMAPERVVEALLRGA